MHARGVLSSSANTRKVHMSTKVDEDCWRLGGLSSGGIDTRCEMYIVALSQN